ncbi:MAG: SGNH/GDSL hydrolase family protein, partial [Planctomycetes bacterium]|nr:SGNH/GDSL hydrolase family protein [Planctomycetota bacterium]
MRLRFPWLVALAAALVGAGSALAAEKKPSFFFQDGDRVVMLGDSITEQYLYTNYVEMWTVCRFPSWELTFRNVGIGGDRSPGGNSRFQRDVAAYHPTALTVDFGMNDGNYRAFDQAAFATYRKGLQGIADQAEAADIRVAWITPSPVEKAEKGPPLEGYNQTLEKFSKGVKVIAAKNDGLFIDQFHPFLHLEEKARAANPGNRIGGGDVVHPGPPGQAIMAWAILKGMHFPTLVAAVDIDAAAAKVLRADQCQVTDLAVKEGTITFQQQDAALPFFPPEARSILKWAPIEEELNQYRLQVRGLKPGRYEVRLGGEKVAAYPAEELGAGVNLAAAALAKGPVARQVRAVWKTVRAKNEFFHEEIFRGLVLANIPNRQRQTELKERLAVMPALDQAIHQAL